MDGNFEDIRLFLAVAEEASFSSAARALGLGQPTVSRRIAALEERIGRPLFERGRLGAVPTAAALTLLPAAREAVRCAREFDQLAAGQSDELAGVVRIAAPPGVAVELLAPFAAVLRRELPAVRLEVFAAIEHIDLLRGAADLAIRTRAPQEPGLVSLAEGEVPLAVRAARSYAERVPANPGWADLDWISWTGVHRDVAPRPLLERLVPDFAPSFASDDFVVQLEALRAGLGCMILGAPDPRRPDARDLVTIDLGVELPPATWQLVGTRSSRLVARVQAVAELLESWLDR